MITQCLRHCICLTSIVNVFHTGKQNSAVEEWTNEGVLCRLFKHTPWVISLFGLALRFTPL